MTINKISLTNEDIMQNKISKFVLSCVLSTLLAASVQSKGMTNHYYANPAPATQEWVNDPESPCYWKSVQKSIIKNLYDVYGEKIYDYIPTKPEQ